MLTVSVASVLLVMRACMLAGCGTGWTCVNEPFDPRTADSVERVDLAATGAIVMNGETSIVVRLNDAIFRFAPDEDGMAGARALADAIYRVLLKVAALEEGATRPRRRFAGAGHRSTHTFPEETTDR